MTSSPKPKTTMVSGGINANTPISVLAKSPLLHVLDGSELVVYLKLVAAVAAQRSRRVTMPSHELLPVPRSAVRALQRLVDHGLIRLHYPRGLNVLREIEVL
jgi:hypothetical protein